MDGVKRRYTGFETSSLSPLSACLAMKATGSISERSRVGGRLGNTYREVDLKADSYRQLAGGWESMQKDQPANKLLRIRQKGARDARQQQSDNEIDCRALMGEGGFGCTRPTGLMAVI